MKNTVFAAAVAAAALCAGGAQALTNLVTNGNFETGDFTGWTQFGDTSYTGVVSGCYDLGCPTSGGYQAAFGPVSAFGGIEQTVATRGATMVSFDLSDDSGAGVYVSLGADTLLTQGDVGSYGVTHFSYTVNSVGPQVLAFSFSNPPAYYTLDSVSVVALPEPAAWATMLLGLGLAGASVRRRRRALAAV